jgi:hypothetical protein
VGEGWQDLQHKENPDHAGAEKCEQHAIEGPLTRASLDGFLQLGNPAVGISHLLRFADFLGLRLDLAARFDKHQPAPSHEERHAQIQQPFLHRLILRQSLTNRKQNIADRTASIVLP